MAKENCVLVAASYAVHSVVKLK